MDRTLLFMAAFITFLNAAQAQTRAPGEAEPRPSPPGAESSPPKPASPAETSAQKPASTAEASPQKPASPAEAPKGAAVPRGSVLEEVSGTVRGIDRKEHRLTVDAGAGGTVALSLDRNTMVYTSTGLGTVLDITAGAQIRAGRNADFLAYWVQVRGAAAQAPATQGSGAPAGPPRVEAAGVAGAPSSAGPAPTGTKPPPPGGGSSQ